MYNLNIYVNYSNNEEYQEIVLKLFNLKDYNFDIISSEIEVIYKSLINNININKLLIKISKQYNLDNYATEYAVLIYMIIKNLIK